MMDREQDKKMFGRFGRFGGSVIFLVAIIILSLFMRGSSIVDFSFQDEYFTIQSDSGYARDIRWDEISLVEYRDTLDLGTLIDGTNTKKEQSGTWENEEFGEYLLLTDAKVAGYAVIHTADGVVVVNFESPETTSSLVDAIKGELPQ